MGISKETKAGGGGGGGGLTQHGEEPWNPK